MAAIRAFGDRPTAVSRLTRASDVKTSNFLNFVSRSRRIPTCRDAAGEHWDFNRRRTRSDEGTESWTENHWNGRSLL